MATSQRHGASNLRCKRARRRVDEELRLWCCWLLTTKSSRIVFRRREKRRVSVLLVMVMEEGVLKGATMVLEAAAA